MRLINRDESRHIAVDYHMVEHYASPAYAAWLDTRPRRDLRTEVTAQVALAGFLWHARPFFKDVFFEPMDLVDPSGKRLLEAFKRIQLLGQRIGAKRGVIGAMERFANAIQKSPFGPYAEPFVERMSGLDMRVVRELFTAEEAARAKKQSYAELAEEALSAKLA